ncbi:MAG: hypothetical protein IKL02_10945 [Kiritimatiellae bacterium]|nr:hypothetical protein [Clostridia bacterium]MBR3778091.1 hypothetical protein [Kiritimatiellia bacterium]
MFSAELKPTEAARALLSKCQSGAEMCFTRVKIGSGMLGEADPDTITDVIQEESVRDITSIRRTGDKTYVKFLLTNDNKVPYYLREMALFAKDPDLGEIVYLYGNDGENAELIETAEHSPLEREITLVVTVSNVQSVTAVIPAATSVSREEFEEHSEDEVIHITAEEREAWNNKADLDEEGKISTEYLPDLRDLLGVKELVELVRFTSSGTFDPSDYPTADGLYTIVLQGAGGSGGNTSLHYGGSAGALNVVSNVPLPAKTFDVIVGAGGAPVYVGPDGTMADEPKEGKDGGETQFGPYYAPGGPGGVYNGGYDETIEPEPAEFSGFRSEVGTLLKGGDSFFGKGGATPSSGEKGDGGAGGIGAGGGSCRGNPVTLGTSYYSGAGGDGLVIIYGRVEQRGGEQK